MTRSSLLLLAAALALGACTGADATDTDAPTETDDPTDTPVDTNDTPNETDDTTDTPDDTVPTERSAICLNEVMASNMTSVVLEDATAPDWIELHNPTDAAIDLGGWTISDRADEPGKHQLPAGLRVPAGGFLVLYADDDVEDGPDHVAFSLNRDGGETLVLTAPDGSEDRVALGPSTVDFSIARETDCCVGDCWVSVGGGTPGVSNE